VVSVVIPTYNRYIYLKRALTSLYNQSLPPNEVIVVDDGSTDNTSQIKDDFPAIRYFYQKNSGVSSARNLGIKKASFEWIAFLDSDDEWHKDKLKKQISFHKQNPNIFISYTNERWIKDEKEIKVPKKFKKYGGYIFDRCLSYCIIAPSSSMVHKNLFDEVGLFDEELEVCEDYDLWLRIALKNEIGLVDEKLITKYAGHDDQLSFKHWGMDRFRVKSLEKLLDSIQKETVKKVLLKKYSLLLKGAIKHDKIKDRLFYKKKLHKLQGIKMVKKVKKCLFPAAGYGTRFLPATKAIPKEMLPILTKPLLQYGVSEAVEANIDIMAIVTGRGKRAIEDHFDTSYELEHQIEGTSKETLLDELKTLKEKCVFSYTRQTSMKGLGHAILTGEVLIGNAPFAVVLADDLCDNDEVGVLAQMIELYDKHQCCIVAVEEVPKEDTKKYGVIAGEFIEDDLILVNDMVEKPEPKDAPSNLAIIGRYILTPDIFDILRDTPAGRGGEVQITDALLTQAKEGKVLAYKFKGKRFDCGSVDGFVEATNYFYNKEK